MTTKKGQSSIMGEKEKHHFKTPESYFDNFNERLMQRMQEEEMLSFLPKTDGFKVPENYFEAVNEKILDEISKKEPKVIVLNPYRKWGYLAAGVAAIFLIFFGIYQSAEPPIDFEDLANVEIDAYWEYNELDMSTYELAEAISIEETQLENIEDTSVTSENILEYLDENVEDIEELNLNFEDYD